MAIIGVVADDFTGTASAGVLVARSQAKTGLFFDAEAVREFGEADRLDAVYVSSNSRHLPPQKAYDAVLDVTRELKRMGVRYYSKKIDSTLRGGIGYETDAMLEFLGEDYMAVMVTAIPASNRICVGGHSVIDGVILTETSVAEDVVTPVRECYVPRLIESQSRYSAGLILLKDVKKGSEHLKKCMELSRENGKRILVIDAITMEHLDTIAKACAELAWNVLAVDPGPFTMKLAYHRGAIGKERGTENIAAEQTAGSIGAERTGNHTAVDGALGNVGVKEGTRIRKDKFALLIIGSANPATKRQIERLCEVNKRVRIISASPEKLIDGGEETDGEVTRVVRKAMELAETAERPEAIVVETALHGSVVNLKEEDQRRGLTKGMSSVRINDGLARIAKGILEQAGQERIAGLLLTGGDTMESVCRKIDVACIQAMDNIVAQVDVGRIIGKYDGLPVVVKGGFCGYEDVAVDIVDRLFLEASR